MPYISVLMPVRNEERYLTATITSLARQTFTDWELIAVDDGSSDSTPEILATAAELDNRVKVITHSGGLVSALNCGLAACSAPLLARLDGDDICHPQRLALQAEFLDLNPETGLVATNFRHFPRTTLKQGMLDYETWQNSLYQHDIIVRDIFVESPFAHPSVMTRTHIIRSLGGYHDYGWPEDYDLWLRMHAEGIHFARLPQTLLFWRDHPERATRTMDEYSANAFRNCKCHYLLEGYLKDAQDLVIAGAGLEARAWQRALENSGIAISAWLDIDPQKHGRLLHGASIFSPYDIELNGRKMIVAIGVRGSREQFRILARKRGWKEGVDFVCVA